MKYGYMKSVTKSTAIRLLFSLLMIPVVQAGAQSPRTRAHAPRPAPGRYVAQAAQNDVPQRTTASYGNWVLQCEITTKTPQHEICDMAQVTQLKGKNVPFSRASVDRPAKGGPVVLTIQVPVNVSFKTEVRIQTGDNDPGVTAPFARCTPSGCFAEFELKTDALKRLHAATRVGKFTFADARGHNVTIPISFEGFGQAFDALMKK